MAFPELGMDAPGGRDSELFGFGGGQDDDNKGGGGGGLMKALKGLKSKANLTPVNVGLAAVGAIKNIAGKVKEKRADAMLPGDVDPAIQSKRRQLERAARAARTGTLSRAKRAGRQQFMTGVTKAGFKAGGGQQGLNKILQAAYGFMGQDTDDATAKELAYTTPAIDLLKREEDRKLQLGMQRFDYAQSRAAQQRDESKKAFNLGLARLAPVGDVNADIASLAPTPSARRQADTETERTKYKLGTGGYSSEETTK
jgi:hypothetical protein